jgi:general secretion pathway protein D
MSSATRRASISAALIAIFVAALLHAAPASRPSATQPAQKFTLNFKDVPLDAVLSYFSQTIGFEILKDSAIDTRVTLMSKQPVSSEEAITMLDAALKANGFAVTREGRLLHIASRDKAKKGNVPVHFGANAADIPDTEEFITQVVPILNVSAEKLRDDLKPILPPDADVAANAGSNTIIITDAASSVRRIVEIISQIDQHEATTSELRIVQLKHASATEVAKIIDTLFKPGAEQGSPQQMQMRMMQPQPNPQGQAQGGGSEKHGQTVITAADERTNTLLVMASSGVLDVVDGIIAKLDTDNPNPAPASEMRAYTLKYAASDATAKLINDIFKQSSESPFPFLIFGGEGPSNDKKGPNVKAVSDDRTNTVVVTAPAEQLKEVEVLLHQLDTSPMVSQDTRVIHLKYADADDVATVIKDMYSPKKAENNNGDFGIIFLSPEPDTPKVRGISVSVTSDERTNTLLVSAPSAMLDGIEKLVRQLDSDPASEDSLFVYHLRNAQATHLEYTLNVLFGNVQTANPNQQQNQQGQLNFQPQQQQNQLVNTQDNSNNSNTNGNSRNQNNKNQRPTGSQVATSELTGKVLVVADQDTNSLLVTTATKYEEPVRELIEKLDRPAPQVLIRVLIAEVTHENKADFGTDFSVLNLRPSGNGQKYGSTLGAAAAAVSSTTPPGMVISLLESNVMATLQALAQQNRLDVLSRPYILTSDNQQANITVGSEVPFITSTNVDSTGGIHNTAQYQNIGIILNVTPHINPEGSVSMDVSPQISALTAQTVTIQNGVSLPVFDVRSAESYITVHDGQTVVIGGLMQDQKTESVNKIPLLGDIPLIGKLLFSYTNDDKQKTELLIFLTPHVAAAPDALTPLRESEMKGLKATPNAVAPGVFQEHMRGMERGGPSTQPATSLSPLDSIELRKPSEDSPAGN